METLDTSLGLTISPLDHSEVSQPKPLREYVTHALNHYFSQLGEQEISNLYSLVLSEVEKPLLEAVLEKKRGNQSQTAIALGISRGTLRKLLKQYKLL